MFYVYVLQSLKDKKLYIGFSTDLRKRIKDHNSGGTKSTKTRRPFRPLYYEAHISEKMIEEESNILKQKKVKVV